MYRSAFRKQNNYYFNTFNLTASFFIWMFSLILSVNDGSGKLLAYRGLVDAVQSIVRTGGLKGLYQVSKFYSKKIPVFGDWFVCFDSSWKNTDYTFLKLVSLAVNSARKNRSHFGNFEQSFHNNAIVKGYCVFHKHANSKVHKPPSQLRFSLPSIIITITSNEPWNTETHKTDRNPPITNHKPWPFEPIKVKFCFLRGPLRWLTAGKNAIVGWLLNFTIHMFVKSAVNQHCFISYTPKNLSMKQHGQWGVMTNHFPFRSRLGLLAFHSLCAIQKERTCNKFLPK